MTMEKTTIIIIYNNNIIIITPTSAKACMLRKGWPELLSLNPDWGSPPFWSKVQNMRYALAVIRSREFTLGVIIHL